MGVERWIKEVSLHENAEPVDVIGINHAHSITAGLGQGAAV